MAASESELPWDPLWAYVLGDEEEKSRQWGLRKGRAKEYATDDEGILSYVLDAFGDEVEPEPPTTKRSSLLGRSSVEGDESSTVLSFLATGSEAESHDDDEKAKRRAKEKQREARKLQQQKLKQQQVERAALAKQQAKEKAALRKRQEDEAKLKQRQKADKRAQRQEQVPGEQRSLLNDEKYQRKADETEKRRLRQQRKSRSEGKPVLSYLLPKRRGYKKHGASQSDSNLRSLVFRSETDSRDEPSLGSRDSRRDGSLASSRPRSRSLRKTPKRNDSEQQEEALWGWELHPALFASSPEPAKSTKVSAENEDRKVRFARQRDPEPESSSVWDSGEKIVAELERSQNSLLGWVGFSNSESVSTRQSRGKRLGKVRERKSSSKDTDSNNSFSFSTLPTILGDFTELGVWEDSSGSDSEDNSTLGASQADSTSTTPEESCATSDDELDRSLDDELDRSLDASNGDEDDGTTESIYTHQTDDTSVSEVRLAFQPVHQEEDEETGPLPLSMLDQEEPFDERAPTSDDDISHSLEELVEGIREDFPPRNHRSNAEQESTARGEGLSRDISSAQQLDGYVIEDSLTLNQGRLPGRGVCCSVKNLSSQQLKWTAQSGLPFHELSQQELTRIFPKVRSVTDKQKYVSSSVLGNSSGKSLSAHLQVNPEHGTPQSLFEYEYEKGINMFVFYERFRASCKEMKVSKGSTPDLELSKNKRTMNKITVQVEASTVSRTDSYIRQGDWWGEDEVPLPNIPGVDVVGKLCRVDTEASKRYGLANGDRIISLVKWGGNSRYITLDPSKVVKVPETVDPSAAVCLAHTYLSAFQVLHKGQGNKIRYRETALKGKTILMVGYALSNMGRAIGQLATDAGASQVYAIAKEKHFEGIIALGMTPFRKGETEWHDELAGEVDFIISFEDEDVTSYQNFLSASGEIIMVRNSPKPVDVVSKDKRSRVRQRFQMQKSKTSSYDVYEEWDKNTERCKLDLRHLVLMLEQDKVAPNLLDRISLSKVARAQEMVESKRMSGFIVCEPWLVKKSRVVRL